MTQLILPETQSLELRVTAFEQQVTTLIIQDEADCRVALSMDEVIAEAERQAHEVLDPPVEAAHKTHKATIAVRDRICKPLFELRQMLKTKVRQYMVEAEQSRQAAERHAQEEARQLAEAERIEQAVVAESNGDTATAEMLLNTPVTPQPVVLPSTTPPIDKRRFREAWTFRVVDEALIPRQYLKLDEVKLNQIARAMKSHAQVPGVEFYDASVV